MADLMPGARGALLATLAELESPVSVRTLARHAEVSPQRALDLVNEMRRVGLVLAEAAGSAWMVSLNRRHLLAEPLTDLVRLRGRLIARLTDRLEALPGLAASWLYGSAARGDGGRDSDIDILLVADVDLDDSGWAEATSRLGSDVQAWTGNAAQLVEHTRVSFTALVREQNALVDALRVDGIPLSPGSRGLLRVPR